MGDSIPDGFNNRQILEKTFERLEALYREPVVEPGKLVKIGLKPGWVAVVSDQGECGTAFRFSGHTGGNLPTNMSYGDDLIAAQELAALVGKDLMHVVRENISSPVIPRRSIAVATLGALSQRFLSEESLDDRGFAVRADRDVLMEAIRPDDVVTLIGYGGMVGNLIGKCRELHVADMRSAESLRSTIIGETIEYAPRAVALHGAEEDEAILRQSDVAIITASSLVNGTIEELLGYASKARVIGVYGPSASIIPDVLFENGVNFVMSHHIVNPGLFANDLVNESNMELAIRKNQRYQTVVAGRVG